MTRKQMRENTFRLLFTSLLNDDAIDEIAQSAIEIEDMEVIEISDEVRAFAKAVAEKADELDAIITQLSKKRALSRMPASTLAILRIALYELTVVKTLDASIIISEALRLDKKYAAQEESRFINGLLGAYTRTNGTEVTVEKSAHDSQEDTDE